MATMQQTRRHQTALWDRPRNPIGGLAEDVHEQSLSDHIYGVYICLEQSCTLGGNGQLPQKAPQSAFSVVTTEIE